MSLLKNGKNKLNEIDRIFAGEFQSQIKCFKCKSVSNKVDPTMDISLDIRNCKSIEQALHQFTVPEVLRKDNQYFCEKCKCKTDAQKRVTIHKLPQIITVHLKRFGFSQYDAKITRQYYFFLMSIKFPENLNISPYVSEDVKNVFDYKLYGVIVHAGGSCRSGHYYAFLKSKDGWYEMDDSSVTKTNTKRVLSQSAYILFYQKVAKTFDSKEKLVIEKPEFNNAEDLKQNQQSLDVLKQKSEKIVNSTFKTWVVKAINNEDINPKPVSVKSEIKSQPESYTKKQMDFLKSLTVLPNLSEDALRVNQNDDKKAYLESNQNIKNQREKNSSKDENFPKNVDPNNFSTFQQAMLNQNVGLSTWYILLYTGII
jgi:predicted metal-dependent hydrolase